MTEVNEGIWERVSGTIAEMLQESAAFDYEEWSARLERRLEDEGFAEYWQTAFSYNEKALFNMFLAALRGGDHRETNVERGRE